MGSDDEPANTIELQPKRTTSLAAIRRQKPSVQDDLATRILMEREKTKYWARLLLLFPLVPVCLALTTIVVGGVVINVATNNCNADLMRFMQGAVVLSHVLVCFYTYCWIGPWPIKSLLTVRVYYLVYGFVCVLWWGIYGTMQAVTATSSGFESCLSMSPTLYIFSQYEVAAFWVVFIAAIAFFVNEKITRLRQDKLDEWKQNKETATRNRHKYKDIRDRVGQDTHEKARKLEEEHMNTSASQKHDDKDERNEGAETLEDINGYDNNNEEQRL